MQDCVVALRQSGVTIRMEDAAKGLQAKLSLKPEVGTDSDSSEYVCTSTRIHVLQRHQMAVTPQLRIHGNRGVDY